MSEEYDLTWWQQIIAALCFVGVVFAIVWLVYLAIALIVVSGFVVPSPIEAACYITDSNHWLCRRY